MIKITATDDVPNEPLNEFRAETAAELNLQIEEERYFLKSLDAPSWVRLVAELDWWQQALSAASALYIAELVKEAAKETWKSRAKLLTVAASSVRAIRTLAVRLVQLKRKLEERTEVVVGVPLPHEYFDTQLILRAKDPAETEIELALFVHYLPAVKALIDEQASKNQPASTGYFLEIQPNTDLLVWWFDSETLRRIEAHISLADEV